MTVESSVDLIRQTLWAAFWLSAPLLIIGFLAGVVVSLAQIVTSMQDSAVGTVPRLAAFLGGTALLLPWMLSRLMTFTTTLFGDFSRFTR